MRMICGLLVALVLPASASAYVSGGGGLDFEWPADGVVSSPFGPRAGGFHPGLDIGSLRRLDVVAASSGLVVRAGEVPGYDGYGNVVVVDDGGGFTTIYAHLDRPLARTGAFVTRGEKIGIAGCTGWCTGTHLHFELRDQGRPVDPFLLLTLGYTAPTQGG